MQTKDELNSAFGIEDKIVFKEDAPGIIVAYIRNQFATAQLSLYGAQMLSFIPKGGEDLLYMSPDSNYEVGKAIRGGIPICFPWFGPHATDATLPQHGFGRIMYWEVVEVSEYVTGEMYIRLSLKTNEETVRFWPYKFHAEFTVVVSDRLEVNLIVQNAGDETFSYTSALHTYFQVKDINNVSIDGLKDTPYYWGFDDEKHMQNEELLRIEQEENRRYVNTTAKCVINDTLGNRQIIAEKHGSQVTVVWNPWQQTIKEMKDLPDEDYKRFVCLETANAYADLVTLQSGGHHSTTVILSLKK